MKRKHRTETEGCPQGKRGEDKLGLGVEMWETGTNWTKRLGLAAGWGKMDWELDGMRGGWFIGFKVRRNH